MGIHFCPQRGTLRAPPGATCSWWFPREERGGSRPRPQNLAGVKVPRQPPKPPLQIQRSAYAVAFDERFSVPLDPAALEENSLRFSVFGVDEDERSVSTGVAELKLSDLDLPARPFNAWLYLQDTNKVGSASRPGFWGASPLGG